MTLFTTVTIVAALLGAALIGGVFFAFSSFIMKALARLPSAEGVAAMQSINVVVLNRSFLGAFMGTAALSLLVAVLAIIGWGTPSAPYAFAGGLSYLGATFVVTLLGNVPLNNRLAAVSVTDSDATAVWEHYLKRWTRLNTLRTAGSMAAALLFTLGLMQ
ncbi:MAG TPA: anthrone oxygenase family protein [Halomonas sp.]|nr:anthrone oxygenase family protein [Halomonas sp.]